MNILIPLVKANGTAETNDYYHIPSLIEIEKHPVIQYVYENYKDIPNSKFIFIIKKEDHEKFHLGSVMKLLHKDAKIVIANADTKGAACTCLLAIEYINNEEPLLIINGEQYMNVNVPMILNDFIKRDLDGGIITFHSVHPRWSYIRLDEDNYVVETAEKRPISNYATTGAFYFKQGMDFVEASKNMILKDAHVNGQFYICPVYNEMILQQKKIGIYNIPSEDYYSFSTPKGLREFEEFAKNYSFHSFCQKSRGGVTC